ncbi:MAG: glycosyltransferase, partial [Planctomycetota bacterium]
MRIVHLTPGAGDNFYCENCLRDAGLLRAMKRLGHEVFMVPLYLPPRAEANGDVSRTPLFFGGVNVFLQQKCGLFRHTPRWVDKLLDSPRLLALASRKAGMTRARDLGETTLSMLQGEHGRQVKELARLVDFLAADAHPDAIILSNALLLGLAPRIRERLDVPVVCVLQDEDGFLDALPEPYCSQCWDLLRALAAEADGLVSPCRYCSGEMSRRLGCGVHRTIPNGIEPEMYAPAHAPPELPTLGFLSQLAGNKGLDTLAEAFIRLRRRPGLEQVQLRLAGGQTEADAPAVQAMRNRLAKDGCDHAVEVIE